MTWKSKLPATELGWSKEMDSIKYVYVIHITYHILYIIYYSLILSNNY